MDLVKNFGASVAIFFCLCPSTYISGTPDFEPHTVPDQEKKAAIRELAARHSDAESARKSSGQCSKPADTLPGRARTHLLAQRAACGRADHLERSFGSTPVYVCDGGCSLDSGEPGFTWRHSGILNVY